MENILKYSGQPSVVLGYKETLSAFNPNMIGTPISPQLERAIGFYNSNGLINKPMSFSQFKRAVTKINR